MPALDAAAASKLWPKVGPVSDRYRLHEKVHQEKTSQKQLDL